MPSNELCALSFRDFGCIEKVDLKILKKGVTLLAGHNAAGKSTIARAAGLLLTAATMLPGKSKEQMSSVVIRDDQRQAAIQIKSEQGTRVHRYEKSGPVPEATGEPPSSTAIAVGMRVISKMTAAERAKTLVATLKANPTETELGEAMEAIGAKSWQADYWEIISEQGEAGWDLAHQAADGDRLSKVREWNTLTGKKWGTKEGPKWRPQGFDFDLEDATPESLTDAISGAQKALEAALRFEGYNEARIAELEEQVGAEAAISKEIADLTLEIHGHDGSLATAKALLETLPAPDKDQVTQPCPHCEKPLVVSAGKIQKPAERLTDEENAKRRDEIKAQEDRLAALRIKWAQDNETLGAAKARLKVAEAASVELQRLKQQAKAEATQDVATCRALLETATNREILYKRWKKAAELNEQIEVLIKVCELLGDTGLRKTKLRSKLENLNTKVLRPLCYEAGWHDVVIDPESLAISYGNRDYDALPAESEQYRADVTIQVALAVFERAAAVVVDRADVLMETKWREGLFRMLQKANLPALVCMGADKIDDIIGLAPAALYWIEKGKIVAEKIAQAVE